MKKIKLITLFMCIAMAIAGCGKSEEARTVDKQIDEIGEVTLQSSDKITAAEKAVEMLDSEHADQLDNLDDLKDARKKYEELVIADKVSKVEKKISEIGAVTLDSVDKVKEAETEYKKLPKEAKEKISNYEILENAVSQIGPLKEEKANQLISSMRLEEDRVRSMKFYYPSAFRFYSNGSWAADQRCFVLPYLGMDKNSCWLRLICNYTGDDWVFFKGIIFAVDGTQYTRSYNYFDIVRDNESGDVWEYIDSEVTDSDVELLKKIANSNETIVRFQGDDYSHDFIVSAADKEAIKNVVTVYELKN